MKEQQHKSLWDLYHAWLVELLLFNNERIGKLIMIDAKQSAK